ncbi:hypothetical protein KAR91_28385, partial [Candidatus Pacearchaeota archaeon]|nr:hypothetical protein [Candidatus Pacearchaeota archaeon]
VSDVPPMPKVKPAKEETGKDIVLNALKELWGITGEMPPNFRCPKRCSICKFFEIKGLIFRKGYCKKYSIEIGGIGCCDSYIYMTE